MGRREGQGGRTRNAVKRFVATQEGVSHYAHRENINVVAIALIHACAQNLWGYIPGSATPPAEGLVLAEEA